MFNSENIEIAKRLSIVARDGTPSVNWNSYVEVYDYVFGGVGWSAITNIHNHHNEDGTVNCGRSDIIIRLLQGKSSREPSRDGYVELITPKMVGIGGIIDTFPKLIELAKRIRGERKGGNKKDDNDSISKLLE